jgi:putative FmdB family regulatory protein
MPIYEYQCQNCHRSLEKRQKFSDPELTECPHCGGRLEKQISAPAVQFKGGGWYADGYGNKAAAKSGSGESNGSSGDGAGKTASAPSSDASSSSSTPASTPSAPSTPAAPTTPAK